MKVIESAFPAKGPCCLFNRDIEDENILVASLSKVIDENPEKIFVVSQITSKKTSTLNVLSTIFDRGYLIDTKGLRHDFNRATFLLVDANKIETIQENRLLSPEFLGHLHGTLEINGQLAGRP